MHDKHKVKLDKIYPKFWIHSIEGSSKVTFEWDYQSSKPEEVLNENTAYITGYVEGFINCLNDSSIHISCLSGCTATIKNMKRADAERLDEIMKDMLIPMVEAKRKSLQNCLNDPWELVKRAKLAEAAQDNA